MEQIDINKVFEKIDEKEKKRKKIFLLTTSISIFIILISVIFMSNKVRESIAIAKENEILKDSTEIFKIIKDSLYNNESLMESVKSKIIEYYEFDNDREIEGIDILLSDTLNRFYLEKDVTKEMTQKHIERHWKKYPNSSARVLSIDETLILKNKNIKSYSSIKYKSVEDAVWVEYLTEFIFNKEQKIVSIRNYEPLHEIKM